RLEYHDESGSAGRRRAVADRAGPQSGFFALPERQSCKRSNDCNLLMKNKNCFLMKLVVGAALMVLLPTMSHADSLWQDGNSRTMFADKRAVNIGDIVTIVVQENSSANKNNSTTSERQSSLSAAITSFLYSPAN